MDKIVAKIIRMKIRGLALFIIVTLFGFIASPAVLTAQDCEDHAFKTAFMISVTEAYQRGNSPEEHYLDFNGGIQAVKTFLESKIGTTCPGEEYIFVGFEFSLISTVEKVTPTEGEEPTVFEDSFQVGTTSEEYAVKLYPGDPYLRIVMMDRTNPIETEVYDLPVVAYIRFHPVRFLFGEIRLDIKIHSGLWFPHAAQKPPVLRDKDDFGEYELIDDNYQTEMPDVFVKEASGSFHEGKCRNKLEFIKVDEGMGLSLRFEVFAEKEDGRYKYLPDADWSASPYTIIRTYPSVSFQMVIQNPEQKDVSVEIDHQGDCAAPPGVTSDWVQHELTLADQDLLEKYTEESISIEEFIESLYVFEAHGQPSHSGSKVYKSSSKRIVLHIDWTPPSLSTTDFFPDQLKYSISCSTRLDIKVSGLK